MVYTLKHKKRKGGCLSTLLVWVLLFAFLFGCFRFAEKRLFPLPYRDIVLSAASDHTLPPALLYALMKAESNFDASAESSKGAKGLMQLMDKTAAWCSEESGIMLTDIKNPAENIYLGAYYLFFRCTTDKPRSQLPPIMPGREGSTAGFPTPRIPPTERRFPAFRSRKRIDT